MQEHMQLFGRRVGFADEFAALHLGMAALILLRRRARESAVSAIAPRELTVRRGRESRLGTG